MPTIENQEYREAIERLQGLHLLLVEDNILNQQLAFALLETNGLSVDLAENGEQAIEMVQNNSYDCVLMDCQMPVLDGYQATLKIRQQAEFDKLPIIAMTANVMATDIDRAIDSGMNDYISKPLDIRNMFITMARWAG